MRALKTRRHPGAVGEGSPGTQTKRGAMRTTPGLMAAARQHVMRSRDALASGDCVLASVALPVSSASAAFVHEATLLVRHQKGSRLDSDGPNTKEAACSGPGEGSVVRQRRNGIRVRPGSGRMGVGRMIAEEEYVVEESPTQCPRCSSS